MKKLAILLSLLSLSGCTNYLYQGSLRAPDSNGVERENIIYWPKTELLLGKTKGGPAVLMTECGSSIQFDERPEGIVFRGSPAADVDPKTDKPVDLQHICGRFLNFERFADRVAGDLEISILCKGLSDDFSVIERIYIQANDTPYVFKITEDKDWSFFGSPLSAPLPPVCQER
ncbi:MAG: hypothetical protein ACI88A_001734 [Paraglaciecola sp.]|jgi:hypothetical protein